MEHGTLVQPIMATHMKPGHVAIRIFFSSMHRTLPKHCQTAITDSMQIIVQQVSSHPKIYLNHETLSIVELNLCISFKLGSEQILSPSNHISADHYILNILPSHLCQSSVPFTNVTCHCNVLKYIEQNKDAFPISPHSLKNT